MQLSQPAGCLLAFMKFWQLACLLLFVIVVALRWELCSSSLNYIVLFISGIREK